jgi:PEGA domain-containing protein
VRAQNHKDNSKEKQMQFLKPYFRALIALVLFVSLVACVSVAASKADSGERVTVSIQSLPEYGEVYLNGKFVGSTNLVRSLSPGEHTIEVRRAGFDPWSRQLTVAPGSPTRVMALLDRQPK